MADFKETAEKIYAHMVDKENWLSGKVSRRWVLSDYASIQAALDAADYTDADAAAYQVYGETKKPKPTAPAEKETGLRNQLLFMAALTATLRQQFAAGSDVHSRTVLDSHRFEMANNKAVRCHLNKLIKLLPTLAGGKA